MIVYIDDQLPRRESGGQLPRSASIDSMVEAAICARHSEPSQPTTLQLPARSDRAFSLASPAVGRRAKTQRGQAGKCVLRILHICYRPNAQVRISIQNSINLRSEIALQ
ncbi:hypothetical protein ACJJTC_000126 [Scirpophaga incertulas]